MSKKIKTISAAKPRKCNKQSEHQKEQEEEVGPQDLGKLVLNRDTFERLKRESIVKTAEEKLAEAERFVADEKRLNDEKDARKLEMMQHNRTKGLKLNQIDLDAQKKINYILTKALELKQNQEPEIQHCNSLILNTKCHAIRCAQIEEKELLKKEKKQEYLRMEKIVEQQRILACKQYEQELIDERIKKKKQANDLMDQIKDNEFARKVEATKCAQDAKLRKEAAMEAQRAEIKDHQEKLLKQAEMRREFLQINTQLKDIKNIEKDLVKMEIKQMQEYYRAKNEREKEYEDMMAKKKYEKELEIAKIQASQQASQDLQAAKDELNMIRTQDQVEKAWRRKEREDMIKKKKENDDLKEARLQQIQKQRQYHAFEIQREREEFDRIIKLNTEHAKKTKEEEQQTKMRMDEHLKSLTKQINSVEWERIQQRKEFFKEGVIFQEGEIARNKSLRETMQKKIEQIKTHNLPTKYINEIERQLKL